MVETFLTAVSRDVGLDVTTIEARGNLAPDQAPRLRIVLATCVNECPSAVIVDLTRCPVVSPQALSVIASAAGQASTEIPPVIVMVCGDRPAFHEIGREVWRFRGRTEAMAAARQHRADSPSARQSFERSPAAPARLRDWIRTLCGGWAVPDICPDAELVVSELVTNAVTHGGTGGVVEVTLRDGFLHIRVEDESPTPPPATAPMPSGPAGQTVPNGRGLALVRLLSSAWGFLVDSRGTRKVVWAAMRWRPAVA